MGVGRRAVGQGSGVGAACAAPLQPSETPPPFPGCASQLDELNSELEQVRRGNLRTKQAAMPSV